MDTMTLKKKETEIGIDMIQKELSGVSGDVNKSGKGPPLSGEDKEVGAENVDFNFSPEETAKLLELLGSPEIAEMAELLDYTDRNDEKEIEGGIGMASSDASNISRDINKKAKVLPFRPENAEADGENPILDMQKELNALLDQLESSPPISDKERRRPDPLPTAPPHFWDLLTQTRDQFAATKAFASFARDRFRDAELGRRYQKSLLKHILKTISLLNCYADYLRLSNPLRKTNTIHTLIEETLTQHNAQLKAKGVVIIKKQLEKDLPETAIPEVQLRYIIKSLMEYITQSTSPHGSLGLLTRLVDSQEWDENECDQLRRDGKCIEILFVVSRQEKKSDHSPSFHKVREMELILVLVKEIIQKNKGVMKFRPSDEHPMTFISLVLPIERRTVFQFPSLSSVENTFTADV